MMSERTLQTLCHIFSAYCLMLLVVGTLLNLVSFKICFNLKRMNQFVYLSFMMLVDTLSLYFWCLDTFLSSYFHFKLQNLNILFCKFGSFIQFTCLQWSSWLLVAMSLDYFLSALLASHWKTIQVLENRSIRISLLLGFALCIVNLNALYFNGLFEMSREGKLVLKCHESDIVQQWPFLWSIVSFLQFRFHL